LLIDTNTSLTNLQIYKFHYVGLEFTEYKNDQCIVTKDIQSSKKTGFLGLENSINLYEFIMTQHYMTYLLTNKHLQDQAETTLY